jgi:hypothetical protein
MKFIKRQKKNRLCFQKPRDKGVPRNGDNTLRIFKFHTRKGQWEFPLPSRFTSGKITVVLMGR